MGLDLNNARKELILTEDGSHTVLMPDIGESYHSTYGAFTESKIIFLEYGFDAISKKRHSISVLEIGFGTGLNALLTYFQAKRIKAEVSYTAIEPKRLSAELIQRLNYHAFFEDEDAMHIFQQMHQVKYGERIKISDFFSLQILKAGGESIRLREARYDLVYFDAFAPDVQPVLWKKQVFQKIYQSMKFGACLLTYSAKGVVRRNLHEAGFSVESLKGPPGKREVTRATKTN